MKIYVLHCPSPDAESLLRETLRSLPDAIVVGNGISGDITQKENLGVASGYNLAMADAFESGVDYFILANNDIEAEPDAVNILVDALREDKTAGIAVPKILYHEDKNKIWYGGGRVSLWTGISSHVGIGRNDFPKSRTYTEYATGCFMALRTEAAREVGFMDERFSPCYCEDSDYSIRMRNFGWKILYVPEARIYHKVSKSVEAIL